MVVEKLVSWAQLGIHKKPCALLNICGYFDKLIIFIEHAVNQHFIEKKHQELKKQGVDFPEVEIDKIWMQILEYNNLDKIKEFVENLV